MSFLNVMQTFFRGEKLHALFVILPIGVLLITFGAVALKAERGGYAWSTKLGTKVSTAVCTFPAPIWVGVWVGTSARYESLVLGVDGPRRSRPIRQNGLDIAPTPI